MEIRSFEDADEPAVIQLWDRCGLLRPWNDPHKDIARKKRVQRELFFVGTIDGEIVASAMAGYDGHRGWINYLAVDPGRRRQGLAAALMAYLELQLRALGCAKMNLQIRRDTQPPEVPFYTFAPATDGPDLQRVAITAPGITGRATLVVKDVFEGGNGSGTATSCTGFDSCSSLRAALVAGPIAVDVVP